MATVPTAKLTSVPAPSPGTPAVVSKEDKSAAVPAVISRAVFTDLSINLSISASTLNGKDTVNIGLVLNKKSGANSSFIKATEAQNPNLQSDIEVHVPEILMAIALAVLNGQRLPTALLNFNSGV